MSNRPTQFARFSSLSKIWLSAVLALFVFACSREDDSENPASKTTTDFTATSLSDDWMSPSSCGKCHVQAYQSWLESHHAHANRPVNLELDRGAFTKAHVEASQSEKWGVKIKDGKPYFIDKSNSETFPASDVIGYEPLRQYLIKFSDGRYQTQSLSFDPHSNEWFDVFGNEYREKGDWGHWQGQGMNWNSNCAWCHMTDFKKNYNWPTNTYNSSWELHAVTCVQCHSGMKEHASRPNDPIPAEDIHLAMENCATCHSLREELTKNDFQPGSNFNDHFRLTLPVSRGVYHPDGQILMEDYVWTSFKSSKMAHAGVTCMDCHDPHSGRTILPIENNALCMRCHGSGLMDAPRISPEAHSNHSVNSTGNQCVECHMPQTVYMQKDPRRDHGFHSPVPSLTISMGIPNACNRCHTDKSPEWASEWTERWYPHAPISQTISNRAEAIFKAQSQEADAYQSILKLLHQETNDIWKSTFLQLLQPYGANPSVLPVLRRHLKDSSAIVRASALFSLSPYSPPDEWSFLASDPSRLVRISVAEAFYNQGRPVPKELFAEFENYLEMSADRPAGALRYGDFKTLNKDFNAAINLARNAIALEPNNSNSYTQAALLASRAENPTLARQWLEIATQKSPPNPTAFYYLALLNAEEKDFIQAEINFVKAIDIEPQWIRAYYNLIVLYIQNSQWIEAEKYLIRLEEISPNSRESIQLRQYFDQSNSKR